MNYVPTLITLMAAGIAALNVALVVALVALFFPPSRAAVFSLVRTRGKLAIFLLVAGSVVGSLFIQYFAALPPCWLCWWQRVFMYPILVISGIAVLKNTDLSDIADYVLALSLFGAGVALYQHLLQMLPQGSLIPCDASGDCAVRSVFELGYITVPWMALSVFAALIFVAILARRKN